MNTKLSIGTGVFYTGDMANAEGMGSITAEPQPGWFTISMNDGREFRMVPAISFNAAPGRRFWPAQERHDFRQAQLADMQRRYRTTTVPA